MSHPEDNADGHGHEHGRAHAHAHAGSERLDPLTFGTQQNCFGCGPRNPVGFRLQFEREGDEVVARFTPGADFEGPPGIMHGGLQATLADEVAAWTIVGLRGRMGFTGSMEFRLIRPVRVGQPVEARGRIVRDTPRLVTVAVRLLQAGAECFKGKLVFALPDVGAAERILGQALPEDWKRLCR